MNQRSNDEQFRNEYLRDHAERESSPWGKAIAAAGLIGGGVLAYKTGALRPLMEKAIETMGSYRSGRVSAVNQGFRNWTQREFRGGGSLRYKMRMLESDVRDSLSARTTEQYARSMRGENIIDRPGELENLLSQRERMIRQSKSMWDNMTGPDRAKAESLYTDFNGWQTRMIGQMDETIRGKHNITAAQQAAHVKKTGFRYATVRDVINGGHMSAENTTRLHAQSDDFRNFAHNSDKNDKELLDKVYDYKVMINANSGKLSDMRDLSSEFGGMMDTIADDFTIPFVKINPIRMLYLNQFNARNKAPTFEVLERSVRQPAITGNTDTLSSDMIYMNGKVFNPSNFEEMVKDNVRLVDARSGPIARYYRNMAGLSTSHYTRSESLLGRFKWNVGQALDLGFQDEPIGRDISWNYGRGQSAFEGPNLFDPTTWMSWMAKQVHGVTKPYDRVSRIYLEESFGKNARWLAFNNYRGVEESGGIKKYMKQFSAGRKDLENVTTASLFPYGFFERLNSTLNQVGLGLSNQNTGSAVQIAVNLTMRRFVPTMAFVEGVNYANTISDDFLGFQFEDKWAEFYAGTSTDVAAVRDATGVTDWAKNFSHLLPGGEQISALPFVGHFFDWNDSKEETQKYWEDGEDEVRKGRYWEMGNTPFTGGKIEYFAPNWARQTLSDYQYTDSQYGSRNEYFANAAYPTLTHPFAPIKHFITDPYHYEEKHYYDRPYMVTGGFDELQTIPLIGPAVNAIVSPLLKPTRQMHEEYWQASKSETGGLTGEFINGEAILPMFDSVSNDVVGSEEYYENENLAGVNPGSYFIDPNSAEGSLRTHEIDGNGDVINIGRQYTSTSSPPAKVAYTTASGDVQVASVEREQLKWLNYKLKEKGLAGQRGVNMPRLGDGTSVPIEENIMSPQETSQVMGNLYYNMTEMGGAYGFGLSTLAGQFAQGPVLADSSDITSKSRTFWDMNIGNLGGDANEIFRRFLVKDRPQDEYNPIPNTMPSWMPGPEYFTDFQHGDPYTKLKKGEMRLPGEGYEALYGVEVDMDMSIGPSFIGKEIPDIVNHLLRRDEIKDEEEGYVLSTGSDWHERWEEEMMNEGIGLDFEQYVKDDKLNIGGFYDVKADNRRFIQKALNEAEVFKYYSANKDGKGAAEYGGFFNKSVDIKQLAVQDEQAYLDWMMQQEKMPIALLDPKTMSTNKYSEDEMFYYNVQQVNFYLHATGLPRGYLIHVPREDIEDGDKKEAFKVYAFDFNPALLEHSINKVQTARAHIKEGMRDGTYGRGDFYDKIDQFRILADTAPYSNQYRQAAKDIRNWEYITDEDLEEVREIEKQVSARKENVRMYDYRFKTADVKKFSVTVTEVLDNNMFLTKEFDNPIKLAGLRAPIGKNDPNAKRAERIINIKPGSRVQVAVNADEQNRINSDTYRSISAVLYNKGININRQLLDSGLVKEREEDFTPASVHARFSNAEITMGSVWESIAHIDSPYNTKLLQVRSPLESYESREVYNKDWQEWTSPMEDFFIPWYQNIIHKSAPVAMVAGTLLGYNFGNTKYGKVVGAAAGFLLAMGGASYVGAYETTTGKTWIPERRKKEREMHEYLDVLKYIKYRRLYEGAADESLRQGFDVRRYLADKKVDGDMRAAERRNLQEIKRQIVTGQGEVREKATQEAEDRISRMNDTIKAKAAEKGIVSALNMRINELTNTREVEEIPSVAADALMFYQETEQTMYGYDPGEPLSNLLAAVPKQDRDYLIPFMQAPEEEREAILGVVPDYMRRSLGAAWGEEVEEKKDLVEYFQGHGLPDQDWIGWDERASLKDLKVKLVKKHGLDPSEFDIWPDNEQQASMVNLPAPEINENNSVESVKSRLSDILRGIGLQNVIVDVTEKGEGHSTVHANILKDRREEVMARMNEDASRLL